MKEQGLYNPSFEHENCGAGFICSLEGKKTNDIISKALNILTCLEHRGAVSSDGRTGDGAGILIEIPNNFFKKECKFELPEFKEYAVGMVFLPPKKNQLNYCVDIFEQEIKRQGLNILGWRDVPVDDSVLGETVKNNAPIIRQFFIQKGKNTKTEKEFQRKLYVIRKQSLFLLQEELQDDCDDFYIVSLSTRTIIFKGMVLAPNLSKFYIDFQNKNFKTAIALFHQRFSTNTFPSWRLAQPFRYLCHNGEINTVKGNSNWMNSRRYSMYSEVLGDDLKKRIKFLLSFLKD